MVAFSSLFPLLARTYALDLAINAGAFLVSSAFQTEYFYDLTGSTSYIACTIYTLLAGRGGGSARVGFQRMVNGGGVGGMMRELHPRQVIAGVTTVMWALRLGSFLFYRVNTLKGDHRFDDVKQHFFKFMSYWFVQSIWVATTALPVYICNLTPPSEQLPLSWPDYVGLAMWTVGFAWESVADIQKFRWQMRVGEKRKSTVFRGGLFKYSQFPNYFGEISLWWGSYLLSSRAVASNPLLRTALAISPSFVMFILTRVSGIPLQREAAKTRFANNPEYKEYTRTTNLLLPWFPKSRKD